MGGQVRNETPLSDDQQQPTVAVRGLGITDGSTNAESREGEGPQAQAEHGVATDWVITRLNVNQGEKSKE